MWSRAQRLCRERKRYTRVCVHDERIQKKTRAQRQQLWKHTKTVNIREIWNGEFYVCSRIFLLLLSESNAWEYKWVFFTNSCTKRQHTFVNLLAWIRSRAGLLLYTRLCRNTVSFTTHASIGAEFVCQKVKNCVFQSFSDSVALAAYWQLPLNGCERKCVYHNSAKCSLTAKIRLHSAC